MYKYPVIDLKATGENIIRLRKEKGLSVRDIQAFFGFEEPQAIYKWQRGLSLPTVDNLYALSALLEVPMDEILISRQAQLNMAVHEQQMSEPAAHVFFGAPGGRTFYRMIVTRTAGGGKVLAELQGYPSRGTQLCTLSEKHRSLRTKDRQQQYLIHKVYLRLHTSSTY